MEPECDIEPEDGARPSCRVCESEHRQEADVLFLRGYRTDQVRDALQGSGLDMRALRNHLFQGHVVADASSLSTVVIQMAQEVRAHAERYDALASEPDGRYHPDSPRSRFKEPMTKSMRPGTTRRGQMVHAYFRDYMAMQARLVEMLGRLSGAVLKKDDKSNPAQVTNNTLNLIMQGDPDMVTRIARTQLEKLGYEVKPKIAALLSEQKKTDAA